MFCFCVRLKRDLWWFTLIARLDDPFNQSENKKRNPASQISELCRVPLEDEVRLMMRG